MTRKTFSNLELIYLRFLGLTIAIVVFILLNSINIYNLNIPIKLNLINPKHWVDFMWDKLIKRETKTGIELTNEFMQKSAKNFIESYSNGGSLDSEDVDENDVAL